MQTIYRIKGKELTRRFFESLKKVIEGREVEITIKTIEPGNPAVPGQSSLLEMISENRRKAPVISNEIIIRDLIDESQFPS